MNFFQLFLKVFVDAKATSQAIQNPPIYNLTKADNLIRTNKRRIVQMLKFTPGPRRVKVAKQIAVRVLAATKY